MAKQWLVMSPTALLHTIRGEKLLRDLGKEEGLSYDRLAKHVLHKPMPDGKEPPPHVKGWRLLSKSQWLRRGETWVCVVGVDAASFIKFINGAVDHPITGAFSEADAPRLAHLLNSGWVWSNNNQVDHMHGWTLSNEGPVNPEKWVLKISPPSQYAASEARAGCACSNLDPHTRRIARHDVAIAACALEPPFRRLPRRCRPAERRFQLWGSCRWADAACPSCRTWCRFGIAITFDLALVCCCPREPTRCICAGVTLSPPLAQVPTSGAQISIVAAVGVGGMAVGWAEGGV